MKEYVVSQEYIDGIYTDEGSTFGLDMQKELVRCKDCKHNKNNKWVDCPIKEFFGRTLDNYCSLAERKEE